MTALDRALVGWREWVGLPDLGTAWIKAKIDTGARSSSLHAFDLSTFDHEGAEWVKFSIHPWQESASDVVSAEAPVLEWRAVRSSSGKSSERPVIRTSLRLGESIFEMDLTLTRRDEMGFRILVGREAIRRRLVVDPARSYLAGKPDGHVLGANRRRLTRPVETDSAA